MSDKDTLLKEIDELLAGKGAITPSTPKPSVFDELTRTLQGVTSPELEYILASDNIVSIENDMVKAFNSWLFGRYRGEFSHDHPDICKQYVDTAKANREAYAKLSIDLVKENAELKLIYTLLLF